MANPAGTACAICDCSAADVLAAQRMIATPHGKRLVAKYRYIHHGQKHQGQQVATSSPPMMAKAIGPQNTVGAIGTRPRIVEMAARIIGRNREVAEVITASYTLRPSLRSVSICTIRITAFFAIMPSKARMPRIATNPSGWLNTSKVSTTPIRPSGSTQTTIARRRKLTSMTIMIVNIRNQHQGHDRKHRCARHIAFLVQTARLNPVLRRQRRGKFINFRTQSANHGIGQHTSDDIGAHGDRGLTVAPPDQRELLLFGEAGKLAQRHHTAAWRGHFQCTERFERSPLVIGGTRQYVDQVNVVAQLRHYRARNGGIECSGQGAPN